MGILDSLTGALGMRVKPQQIQQVKTPPWLRGKSLNPIADQGMGNLSDILGSEGRADPRAMNRVLTNIGRRGEGARMEAGGRFAGAGLQDSGLASALDAAMQQGTVGQMAGVEADEVARAEERKRNDIMQLLMPLLQMKLGMKGMKQGVFSQQAGLNQQAGAMNAGMINNLIAAAMGGAGSYLGNRGTKSGESGESGESGG